MNAAFTCRATAASLRALRPLMTAAHVGAVAAGIWLTAQPSPWLIASLAVWAPGLYLAVRVHLDAELLELLATDPERHPAELDEFLVRAGLRRSPINCSIEERCQGARRWGSRLVLAVVLQLALVVAGVMRTAR